MLHILHMVYILYVSHFTYGLYIIYGIWYILYMVYMKVKVKVTQSCPTLCDPVDYTVQGIFQARIWEWVAFPFSRGSSQPRDWTQVSHTADGFMTSLEPQGKPKNTRVGSLCLLQQIFPTQELNRSFLHCRRILYQQLTGKPLYGIYVIHCIHYIWYIYYMCYIIGKKNKYYY